MRTNVATRVTELRPGDVTTGSRLRIVSVHAPGLHTPRGKVEITVENIDASKRWLVVWGKSTRIRVERRGQ